MTCMIIPFQVTRSVGKVTFMILRDGELSRVCIASSSFGVLVPCRDWDN